MPFDAGIDIKPLTAPLGFRFGPGVFGPLPELRPLDSIRKSLLDPDCNGPDPVYAIAMDVGKVEHRTMLVERNLLFGVVTYAAGRLGREPVRSQGHAHKRARNNRLSPPEVYEIWSGKSIIYMQESADDNPGRCFAVEAGPGDVVVVPPDWVHAAVSADHNEPLTFGAWCDRDYSFEYGKVRVHGGIAWYPVLDDEGRIDWLRNTKYSTGELVRKPPSSYPELGISKGTSIYKTFERNPDIFNYVTDPETKLDIWKDFVP